MSRFKRFNVVLYRMIIFFNKFFDFRVRSVVRFEKNVMFFGVL